MNEISVVITSFRDRRIFNLIKELSKFNPFEIIIADGGSQQDMLDQFRSLQNDVIKFYFLPGNIAETRYQVQNLIRGDITVFIDTDEFPTETWLEKLTAPIRNGECDFTFGPTIPMRAPDNRFTRYLNDYDDFLYKYIVPRDILKGAMGNSAWRSELIKKVGFDPCLGIGGEDYDLTIRAYINGFRGKFVEDAVLRHDQNNVRTLRRFLKKVFYNYMVGASLAYRKSNMLFGRAKNSATRNIRFRDPLEVLIFLLKPFALLFSLMLNPWENPKYCREEFMPLKNH